MPDLEFAGVPAFVATPPTGDGPWPGVVVIHEMFGLIDDIREHATRIAAAGYVAVAPDLFRGGGALPCLPGTFDALRAADRRQSEDIDSARRELAPNEDCPGRV